jgi:uncharacterized RmlC-like cupin family protein
MSASDELGCRVVRSDATYEGAQGLTHRAGLSAESAGTRGICMTVVIMPPGARARAHYHRDIETAIYVLEGEAVTHFGDALQHRVTCRAGDYVYIAPNTPHVVVNRSDRECRAVVTHTGPDEQAGIVLLPELDSRM